MNVDVLVVGASLAGWTCAETLRQDGFDGSIVVAGAEEHPPYDRPPLSKKVLAGIAGFDSIRLGDPERAVELDIALWLGAQAISCDTAARTVQFADGREVHYGELVIATGVRPRPLPGARTLRNLDDARELGSLPADTSVVVAGAGFLGTELAATLATLRHRVTLVSETELLLGNQLGTQLAELISGLHRDHGVKVVTGLVDTITDEVGRKIVATSTGERLEADEVVACIGAIPNSDWLDGSGLTLGNGVLCDEHGRAGQHEWAIGDVASWAGRRVEHRMSASSHGVDLARRLLAHHRGEDPTVVHPMNRTVPYVWTDQFDKTIQLYGRTDDVDRRELIAGSVESGKLVVLCGRRGKLVGVIGTSMAKVTIRACKQILAGADFDVEALREILETTAVKR